MTKIHINLSLGLIEVEGEETFVQSVYNDLKVVIANKLENSTKDTSHAKESDAAESPSGSTSSKKRSQKKSSDSGKAKNVSGYQPKLDNSLKIEELEDFYKQYLPSSLSERILLFCKYIHNVTNSTTSTVDQIYTCFSVLKETHPKDYMTAMRDARKSRYGFINFSTVDDISVTNVGENHFNKKLKRNSAE